MHFTNYFTCPISWSKKWKCTTYEKNLQQNTISRIKENPISVSEHVKVSLNSVPIEKSYGIPKRIIFLLLGFTGMISSATMRYNLSVAIVAMVNTSMEIDDLSFNDSTDACLELMENSHISNSTPIQTGEFDWDPELQQLSLASFYFGYLVSQIPGGIISEKYYAKHAIGVGNLLTSIFTLLTPIAARYSVWALIVARVIEGCGQGIIIPSMNSLIGRWIPSTERSRASVLIYTGITTGSIFSFTLTGLLCESEILGGWPSSFYIFGFIGCVWYFFWHFFVYESPDLHPYITKAEIMHIREGREETSSKRQIPWRCIFTSLPVWGLVITHLGNNWGFVSLMTETPIYLSSILHFDLKQNGVLSSLPSIIRTIVACIASILTDKLREREVFHITTLRKIMNSIGFYGAGICILFVKFAGCSSTITVILLCLSMSFNSFSSAGFLVTHVDMSPEYAGILMGLTNTGATIPGFLAPIYVGWIIKDGNTLHNWGIIFVTIFIVYVFCGTVYNIFCESDLQQWEPETKQESIPQPKETSDPKVVLS